MFNFFKSRVGAVIIIIVVAAVAIWGGVTRSANENYSQVSNAKFRAANNLIAVADQYPSVNLDTLKSLYYQVSQYEMMNSDINSDYKKAVSELDREFLLVYNDLLLEQLTKDHRRDLEYYYNDYKEGAAQLSSVSKFVLGVK